MDRWLAVSVEGGHLVELRALLPRMTQGAQVDWITSDTPQAKTLLDGERVRYAPVIGHKDVRSVASIVPEAVRVLRGGRYTNVVGSGALSLSYLPTAAALGAKAHFIESATRLRGPSLTGKVLSRVPGVHTYTQGPDWAGGRWQYRGSVLDQYAPGPPREAGEIRRVLVTLGTNPFPFRRVLERLIEILPPGLDVVWQTGSTDTTGLPIDAQVELTSEALDEEMRRADVIVAHAGAGSSLQALSLGRVPVLVPRRFKLGEQSDDHQPPLARELQRRGLAVAADVELLTFAALEEAAARTARTVEDPPPFRLD